MNISACVIGCGKAGARFIKAINYLHKTGAGIEIKFACDTNPLHLESCGVGSGVKKYSDYKNAFTENSDVDFIFVCVNEHAHYEILSYIKDQSIKYLRIISEKPLTETLSQANHISELYKNEDITLNFVERYSPIVSDYHEWKRENNLAPVKANFFWGKYRIHDPRKTMGVLSEISHPLDLTLYLMDIKPHEEISLEQAIGQKSDYSPYKADLIDTVSISLKLKEQFVITGHSSFVWETRRRTISVFLQDSNQVCRYMAVCNFDDPVWDMDNLKIYDIIKSPGRMELVKEFDYGGEDCKQEIFKVNKIYKFILENIANVYQDKKSCNLAYLDQAIYIQSILDLIEKGISRDVQQNLYQNQLTHLSAESRFVNEEASEEDFV